MTRHRCPGFLCDRCSVRLAELLNPGAGLDTPTPSLAALWRCLSPVPGQGSAEGRANVKPGPRSPADDEALSLTDPRSDPYRACLLAGNELGATFPPLPFPELCAYLYCAVPEITGLPWAGEFLADIERTYRRMRQAAGVPIPARIGTCDACGEGLYASSSGIVECGECLTTYDARESISASLRGSN